LSCTPKVFKETFLSVFPKIKELIQDIRATFKRGEPIRTWGGRLYYCEEPRLIKGVLRNFEYKGINYLVQSSSSDVTKEAILRFNELKKESRFLLTVHDENTAVAPKKYWKQELKALKEAMEGIDLDAPLTCDGYVGDSWGALKDA
jgi:DNA polymerase I-like protein with 3'-5' exonuclease and polymerase domains